MAIPSHFHGVFFFFKKKKNQRSNLVDQFYCVFALTASFQLQNNWMQVDADALATDVLLPSFCGFFHFLMIDMVL